MPPEVVAYSKIGRGLTWRLHCDSVAASPTGSLIWINERAARAASLSIVRRRLHKTVK